MDNHCCFHVRQLPMYEVWKFSINLKSNMKKIEQDERTQEWQREVRAAFERLEKKEKQYEEMFGEGSLARMSSKQFEKDRNGNKKN